MEELVDEGLAKNIGIRSIERLSKYLFSILIYFTSSNFQGSLILDILRYARIEPQVLQVELHPYLTQQPLVDLASTLGIAVTAYSSFGSESYIELGDHKTVPRLMEHNVIVEIAKAKQRSWSTFQDDIDQC